MKKILLLVLTVFAFAACQPDNWLPDSFTPGTTTGGNSNNTENGGNGTGGNGTATTYSLDQIKRKLAGKWSLSLDDMFFEWYEIKSNMDVNFATAYDEDAQKNWQMHIWKEGEFENMKLESEGGIQYVTVTYRFWCYSYHYDTEQWEEFNSSKKIKINASALMKEDKLYTSDYSIPYVRDSKTYRFGRPY